MECRRHAGIVSLNKADIALVTGFCHCGELTLRCVTGAVERRTEIAPLIRRHPAGQHCSLFPPLSLVVAEAVDPEGGAWATLMSETWAIRPLLITDGH